MSDRFAGIFLLFFIVGAIALEASPVLALALLVGGVVASALAWAWYVRPRRKGKR